MDLRVLVALIALAACGGVRAKDYAQRMQFVEFRPCTGNSDACAPAYLAQGTIDPGAAERLAVTLRTTPNHPRIIAFDSPGGSLITGLEMGRLIRREGLETVVAPAYFEEAVPDTPTGVAGQTAIAKGAGCYSACAYAFMGGVSRTIADGGVVGVHQFAGLGTADAEANAQVGVAMLSMYLQEMGVDRELLDVASITDAGSMAVIPADKARAYNLDNQAPPLEEWRIEALPGGEMGLLVDQRRAGSDAKTLLAFINQGESKRMGVLVFLRGMEEHNRANMVAGMLGVTTTPRVCATTKSCVSMEPRSPWAERGDRAIYATFSVNVDDLETLSAGHGPMYFDAGFPQVYDSQSPSVLVSRAGLQNGLRTLLRH